MSNVESWPSRLTAVVGVEDVLHDAGKRSQGGEHVANALLDALGDDDFASRVSNSTVPISRMYIPHRISRAARLGLHRGEGPQPLPSAASSSTVFSSALIKSSASGALSCTSMPMSLMCR